MTAGNFLEVVVYLAIIVAITPILGRYMARVFSDEKTPLDPVLRPVERALYRICGVDAGQDERRGAPRSQYVVRWRRLRFGT